MSKGWAQPAGVVWEWSWLCEIPAEQKALQQDQLLLLLCSCSQFSLPVELADFVSPEFPFCWAKLGYLLLPPSSSWSVGDRGMSIRMRQRHPRAVSCGEGLGGRWHCPLGEVKLSHPSPNPPSKLSFPVVWVKVRNFWVVEFFVLSLDLVSSTTSDLQLLPWAFPCLESSHMDYSVGGDQTAGHSVCKAWKSCYSGQADTHSSEISCRKSWRDVSVGMCPSHLQGWWVVQTQLLWHEPPLEQKSWVFTPVWLPFISLK